MRSLGLHPKQARFDSGTVLHKMKLCSSCKEKKDISEFSIKNKVKGWIHSSCKQCQKKLKNRHYQRNKKEYLRKSKEASRITQKKIDDYKEWRGCFKCGERHPAALDFHHPDGVKKEFTIALARRRGYSIERIMVEAEKCVVVCSNCHRKIHWEKNNVKI